jgi:cellulose synthase/poly-beta-1,6-N-acetylglucosamine synthase-like glycosyltransferase
VSVVIPVRNEERSLPELIASLQAQTFPPAEVVMVDGGSTDQTVALARRLTAGDGRFRVVEGGRATPGRGRNIGITTARYDLIALSDAGNQLEPQWLECLLAVVQRDPAVAFVYGNFEPVVDSFFTRCASLAYIPPKQARPGGLIRMPFIASSLVRRDAWRQVGGFPDLRAAEDLMFMEAIERQGYKIGWAPQATAWWHMQPTLGRTYKRFEVYSRYNVWAGRQRFWHYGIARQYLFALIFMVMGIVLSPWWFCVIPLGLAARVAKSIWRRREGHRLRWLFNPIQFLGVAVIILTIDLATFVGWAQALWRRPAITAHQEARGEIDL